MSAAEEKDMEDTDVRGAFGEKDRYSIRTVRRRSMWGRREPTANTLANIALARACTITRARAILFETFDVDG